MKTARPAEAGRAGLLGGAGSSEDGQVACGDDPGRVGCHRVVAGGVGVRAGQPVAVAVHDREHRDDVAVAAGRAAVDDLDGEVVGAFVVHGVVVAAAGDL